MVEEASSKHIFPKDSEENGDKHSDKEGVANESGN